MYDTDNVICKGEKIDGIHITYSPTTPCGNYDSDKFVIFQTTQ